MFTSDNGYNLGHNGIWHKGNGWWILTDNQGNRPNIYDNSLRVLLIVRWPSVVPAGSIRGETASHLDWFPTLAEIGGASVAESTVMRGKSILPLLQGDQTEWDNDLFAQYAMWDWNQNGSKLRSFRTPEWKLIQDFRNQGVDELYDLREDPAENQNLIDSPDPAVQQVRDQLNERMLGCMREIDDPELAA